MTNYQLNTAFTNEQLQMLYATGTNVIIAKPAGGGTPNVAWQVFRPFQNNIIEWKEEYGIYVSNAPLVNGATLSQLSSTPVPSYTGKLYTLQDSGAISGPASGGIPNAFALLNQYSGKAYMTIGLFQAATINQVPVASNALTATSVMTHSTIAMTPGTTVYIWLQSGVISNTIVNNVTSPMTKLTFGGGVDSISVSYDSDSGRFIPAGMSLKAANGASFIDHIEPSL